MSLKLLRSACRIIDTYVGLHYFQLFIGLLVATTIVSFSSVYTISCEMHSKSGLFGYGPNQYHSPDFDPTTELGGINDDGVLQYVYSKELLTDVYNVAGAVASIVICIPAVADTFIDAMPFYIIDQLYKDDRHRIKPVSNEILRFTHFERFLFVVGIVINPLLILYIAANPPTNYSSNHIPYRMFERELLITKLLGDCYVVAPVMMLLSRLSTVWSPSFAFSIQLLLSIGTVFSLRKGAPPCTLTTANYKIGDNVGHISALILGFLGVVASLAVYCREFVLTYKNRDTVSSSSQVAMDKKFRGAVIGAHITIFLLELCTFLSRIIFVPERNAHAKTRFGTFSIALLVFVVESRIRVNEINRSLYAAIDTRKQYARYVEGELRSPLSIGLLSVRFVMGRLTSVMKDTEEDIMAYMNDIVAAFVAVSNTIGGFLQLENLNLMESDGQTQLPTKQMTSIVLFLRKCFEVFLYDASKQGISFKLDLSALQRLVKEGDEGSSVHDGNSMLNIDGYAAKAKWDRDVHSKVRVARTMKHLSRSVSCVISVSYTASPYLTLPHQMPCNLTCCQLLTRPRRSRNATSLSPLGAH